LFDVRRMAKDQKQEQAPPPAPEGTEALGPPKSFRLYIVLGFFSLILFEVLILWLALPGRAPATLQVGINAGEVPQGIDDVSTVPADIGKQKDLIEKPIGEKTTFKFKNTKDGTTISVSLIMTVKVQKADDYKFTTEYTNHMNEIIEAVTRELWKATREDYQEVSRATIKERVKKAINEILSSPYVKQVVITELNYEEQ